MMNTKHKVTAGGRTQTRSANAGNTDPTSVESHEETGHTPGPWKPFTRYVLSNGRFLATAHAIGDNPAYGTGFAADQEPTQDMNEAEANARLIAAAPELLGVLKQVHAILSQSVAFSDESANDQKSLEILRGDCFAARQVINAAIAKAKGLTPCYADSRERDAQGSAERAGETNTDTPRDSL